MAQKLAPPTRPENIEEFLTRQLEYYQQLKQYHQYQMLLAQKKFNCLKNLLELELPNTAINLESRAKPNSEIIVKQETTQAEQGKQEVEESFDSKTNLPAAEQIISTQNLLVNQFKNDLPVSVRTNGQAASESEIREQQENLVVNESISSKQEQEIFIPSRNIDSITIATEEEIKEESVVSSVERSPDSLQIDERNNSNSVVETETNIEKKNTPVVACTEADALKQDLPGFVPLEQKVLLYGTTYADLVAQILQENYPKSMRTEDILQVLYPEDLPYQTAKKYREAIRFALSSNLWKKLWRRQKRGLYRAIIKKEKLEVSTTELNRNECSKIDSRQDGCAENNSDNGSGEDIEKTAVFPNHNASELMAKNEVVLNLDNTTISLAEKLSRYGENRALALANILGQNFPKSMKNKDIVGILYPEGLPKELFRKYSIMIGTDLSRNLRKKLWERVSEGLYRAVLPEDVSSIKVKTVNSQANLKEEETKKITEPERLNFAREQATNKSSQTAITSKIESKTDLIFEKIETNIKAIFAAEEPAAILHLNYIA